MAVAIVGPTVLLTQRLGREVAWGVGWVQSEYTSGHWRAALERHPWLATVLSWLGGGVDVGGAADRLLSTLSSNIPSALTVSVWAVAELLITLFALFYLFRDRRPALRALRSLVPLSEAEVEEVFRRVADTIYATVYGTLTVALVQGLLSGSMF